MTHRTSTWLPGALLLALTGTPVLAEEGMWTFDNPPAKALSEKYGFSPTAEWLDHVRMASVRFMDGGSGAFVSPFGLVVTNHHVASGQLQKMSSKDKDYLAEGFYAAHPEDEIKCPDLELMVLMAMEDVTAQVIGVVKPGMDGEAALKARDAERARIEKENMEKTGLHAEVVGLYRGGEYWLYRYEKYTDVRLVFAPEQQVANYGGDSDNFTFPRHDLDVAFVRVYQDGKPVQAKHFLRWSPSGASDGDLVFVTGHPGRSERLKTMGQLELMRDSFYGLRLSLIDRFLGALAVYEKKGKEQFRRAKAWRFRFENARKAYGGMFRALKDPRIMSARRKIEDDLRARIDANPAWKKAYGQAFTRIDATVTEHAKEAKRRGFHAIFASRLADLATDIVKYVHEIKKPDAERLKGFHDSELPRLRYKLFSPAPIFSDLQAVMIASSFGISLEQLPKDDPYARILREAGDSDKLAGKLTAGTRLADPAFRKELIEGGIQAVEKSDDPFIAFARKIVPILIEDEVWTKKHLESVLTTEGEKIARARFAVHGKNAYPDATFSLRMTFGTVRGYPMNGTRAPAKTTLYGMFDRALGFNNQGAWTLPDRYWDRLEQLNLATPVNFAIDCDIIGGNSGSPVINREADLVGVVFDGNIESLSNAFTFDAKHSRGIAVHSAFVLEVLRNLYDAHDLADEIEMR